MNDKFKKNWCEFNNGIMNVTNNPFNYFPHVKTSNSVDLHVECNKTQCRLPLRQFLCKWIYNKIFSIVTNITLSHNSTNLFYSSLNYH